MAKNSNLRKITVYRRGFLGNIDAYEGYLLELKRMPHDGVVFQKKGSRRDHPSWPLCTSEEQLLIVVEGWGKIKPDGLCDENTKKRRYPSHDPRWLGDFLTRFESQTDLVCIIKHIADDRRTATDEQPLTKDSNAALAW